MRYVHALLCLLMLLFIAVQYNDPDGLLWMTLYLVPAIWAGLAAIHPRLMQSVLARRLLSCSIAAALAATVWFWPHGDRWWTQEVWYETEAAREGMGMMIVTIVLLLVRWLPRRAHS